MLRNIAPKIPHQEAGNCSTPRTSATGNVEVNSDGLNNADTKAVSPAESIPIKEKLVYTKKHWTAPSTKSEDLAIELHQLDKKVSVDEKKLTENILRLLNVGSNDSLNIMEGIFKFHRYDMTLLKRYIDDRTPKNFSALKIQIESRLFLGGPAKPQKSV